MDRQKVWISEEANYIIVHIAGSSAILRGRKEKSAEEIVSAEVEKMGQGTNKKKISIQDVDRTIHSKYEL